MGELLKIILTITLALNVGALNTDVTETQIKEDYNEIIEDAVEETVKETVEEIKTYKLNYTIDTSNSLINGNEVLGHKIYSIDENDKETCTKEIIDKVFKDFEYNYKKRFKVYLINREAEAFGLTRGNEIIIFDNGRNDRYSEYESTILHEFGHVVYNNLSKKEIEEWKKFRGIPEEWNDNSEYELKPTEIFARDFAYFFGYRNGTGLFGYGSYYTPPYKIEGLRDYIISLGED